MLSLPSPIASVSFVLSRVPDGLNEDYIRTLFADTTEIVKIVFHFACSTLFLNCATIIVPTEDDAKQLSRKYLGKYIGQYGMAINYSLCPNNLSDSAQPGKIALRRPLDDISLPSASRSFLREWRDLTELPDIKEGITNLWLRYNRFVTFDSHFAAIVDLNLKGNDLVSFNGSYPCLEKLDLAFNRLETLPDLYSIAPNLRILDVSYNLLMTLPPNMSKLEKLKTLKLSHNHIAHLVTLPALLNAIHFDHNSIATVDEQQCSPTTIDFRTNCLTEIPQFLDSKVVSSTFNLNPIRTFRAECLMKKIRSFTLTSTHITSLPDDLFEIPTLGTLVLHNNRISSVPATFSQSSLVLFDISENPISSLPTTPSSLKDLRLNFCNFSNLDFIPPSNIIQSLYACDNDLSDLPPLPNLMTLMVAGNKLQRLPNFHPQFLDKVNVSAAFNQIEDVSNLEGTFVLADLSYNKIAHIPDSIFGHQAHIKVQGNPITQTINTELLEKVDSVNICGTSIELDGPIPASLREVCTDMLLPNPRSEPTRLATVNLAFDLRPHVGAAEMLGGRNEMEDALVIRDGVYGVLDGHGGLNTARICAAALPELLQTMPANDAVASLNQSLENINEISGSTLTLAQIDGQVVTLWNLGDSKAAIYSATGETRIATIEMVPTERCEFERLRAEKLPMRNLKAAGLLGTSGAVGDVQFPGIRHEPVKLEYTLQDDDRWLVIGCDGLWDELSLEEAGDRVAATGNAQKAAVFLRDQAYYRGSTDNISVIVVDLKLL